MRRTEINGKEHHRYSNEKYNEFDRLSYLNTYILVTGDSFEIGEAYSLHQTGDAAKRYYAEVWWRKTAEAIPVFISTKTLEAIAGKEKNCIFISWEN